MQVTFLGHSAFYLERGSFSALIDPFISNNPQAPWRLEAILAGQHLKTLSHIFVTHGHGDHIGDTVALARHFDALVIANYEIASYLGEQGLKVHPMHVGGKRDFDFGTVKLTPALHGSSIQTEAGPRDGGNPCGFVISVGGVSLYHAGDTGLTMDMQLLKESEIDLMLVPIGGNFTMDIEDAARAVSFVSPKQVVPMHYNTFGLIQADPELFRAAVVSRCPEVKVSIMSPGAALFLEKV